MGLFSKKKLAEKLPEQKKPHKVIKNLHLWKKGDRINLDCIIGWGDYFFESIDEKGNLYCKIGKFHNDCSCVIEGMRVGEIFKINIFGDKWGERIYRRIRNASLPPLGCEEYQQFLSDLKKAYDEIRSSRM